MLPVRKSSRLSVRSDRSSMRNTAPRSVIIVIATSIDGKPGEVLQVQSE